MNKEDLQKRLADLRNEHKKMNTMVTHGTQQLQVISGHINETQYWLNEISKEEKDNHDKQTDHDEINGKPEVT